MFAASAAVGISSAFNAPVGGLLFSIEITSTFYLVTNYGKSFIAATAGAFASNVFLITQQNYGGNSHDSLIEMTFIPRGEQPFQKWELLIYGLIGVLFSYVALMVLKVNQMSHLLMKPYCKKYPLITCAVVAGVTALVIYFTGAYTSEGVRVFSLASDVLTDGYAAEMKRFKGIPPLVGLLISFFARVFISVIAFNIPLPAGIFVPVFLMGAILGRFVGVVVLYAGNNSAYLPGYALVGGCALASGVTQTISVAVIAIELTGNLDMLLPCLIASVISASMTRPHMMSVYDRTMMNKGLESFYLLLRESLHGFRNAADIMCSGPDMVCIPQNCSALDLLRIINSNPSTQFPVVDSLKSLKLLGTLSRSDVFEFLFIIFHEWNMNDLLLILLPVDSLEYENRMAKKESRNGIKKLRKKVTNFLSMKPPLQEVSMTDTADDAHYLDEGVKKNCEATDIEDYLKARITLLLTQSSISEVECDVQKVMEGEVMAQNVEKRADGFTSTEADDCKPKDASVSSLSGGGNLMPLSPSLEFRGCNVDIERVESHAADIPSPYYHIDINEGIDNNDETFRRSRAMTIVDIIEGTIKKTWHFLSQIPEAPAPMVAEISQHKTTDVEEDELEAFKLRPITRQRMSSIATSGDQDPEVKERVFLAIKNAVKKRLKEEEKGKTMNLSRGPSFSSSTSLETERDQGKFQSNTPATGVPRATIFVNDADIKNAFREELIKNMNILDSPQLPRVSAFPFRYEI
jgi:hypothetical protein